MGDRLRGGDGRTLSVAIELLEVGRSFGLVSALADVTLAIEDGEFFSMLGPSGSGKTTCLRLIAGFDIPSCGKILLHGCDVSAVPPYDRDINTVFQDYALFPHLSVLDNVAYGLRMKGIDRKKRHAQAEAALEQVALAGLGARRPSQLSGGQRQRVALARALVNKPRVLLLDEPLGALDLKLREQMQVELKTLQRQLGITFVYVTHDQGEALSMSDRVAVFNKGRIEQVDSPRGLYEKPRTIFVAGFVGTATILEGAIARKFTGSDRPVALRPEHLRLGAGPGDALSAQGRIIDIQFHGASSRLAIQVEDTTFAMSIANDGIGHRGSVAAGLKVGDSVEISWPRSAMVELEASESV